MIRYTLRRLRRAPLPAVAMLLFAVVLAVVLCSLKKSNDAEQQKYEETFDTIPVTFSVTNLSGTKSTELSILAVFLYPFEEGGCLAPYVSNLEVVVRYYAVDNTPLEGITTTTLSPDLAEEKGTVITWRDGYDAGILRSEEFVALIPDGMATQIDEKTGEEYVLLQFSRTANNYTREYNCRLTVAGTYTGGDEKTVYCPYEVCTWVYYKMQAAVHLQAIRATLTDNHDLEALRQAKWEWFAEPNALGTKTEWVDGEYGYDYYPFALDIDDTLLKSMAATLESSILTNRICTVLVLFLSAGAGMLIGFLMVRARKREIALLRTMGTSQKSIYLGFAAEQMLCFCLGIALGGIYNRWQPALQLIFLPALFFLGLTAALLVFLRRNLMTTIKEEAE